MIRSNATELANRSQGRRISCPQARESRRHGTKDPQLKNDLPEANGIVWLLFGQELADDLYGPRCIVSRKERAQPVPWEKMSPVSRTSNSLSRAGRICSRDSPARNGWFRNRNPSSTQGSRPQLDGSPIRTKNADRSSGSVDNAGITNWKRSRRSGFSIRSTVRRGSRTRVIANEERAVRRSSSHRFLTAVVPVSTPPGSIHARENRSLRHSSRPSRKPKSKPTSGSTIPTVRFRPE